MPGHGKHNDYFYEGIWPGREFRGIVWCPTVSGCCDENYYRNKGYTSHYGWKGPFYDNKFGIACYPCCEASTFGAGKKDKVDPGGRICYYGHEPCPLLCFPCVYGCVCCTGVSWCCCCFNCCTAMPCSEQDVTAVYAKNNPTLVIKPKSYKRDEQGDMFVEAEAPKQVEISRQVDFASIAPASAVKSKKVQLRECKEMLDEGLITAEDYERQKEHILFGNRPD